MFVNLRSPSRFPYVWTNVSTYQNMSTHSNSHTRSNACLAHALRAGADAQRQGSPDPWPDLDPDTSRLCDGSSGMCGAQCLLHCSWLCLCLYKHFGIFDILWYLLWSLFSLIVLSGNEWCFNIGLRGLGIYICLHICDVWMYLDIFGCICGVWYIWCVWICCDVWIHVGTIGYVWVHVDSCIYI